MFLKLRCFSCGITFKYTQVKRFQLEKLVKSCCFLQNLLSETLPEDYKVKRLLHFKTLIDERANNSSPSGVILRTICFAGTVRRNCRTIPGCMASLVGLDVVSFVSVLFCYV